MKNLNLSVVLLILGIGINQVHCVESQDSLQQKNVLSLDVFPPLLSLSSEIGAEWLAVPRIGLGIWGSGSVGRGSSLISDLNNDYQSLSLGLTWHPSKKLNSGALYLRFYMMESENQLQDETKQVFTIKYSSQQLRAGYLSRGLLWKSLGYYWNVGLGNTVGETKAEWLGGSPQKNADTLLKMFRIMGYLDLNAGLSWQF